MKKLMLILAMVAMVDFAGTAHAGFLSISQAPLDATGSGILSTGTPKIGWNAGQAGDASPLVVQGVSFYTDNSSISPAAPSQPTFAPITITLGSGWNLTGTHNRSLSRPGAPAYTGSMLDLMNDDILTVDATTADTGSSSGRITFGGLTVGNTYRVQFLADQINATSGFPRNTTAWFGTSFSGNGTGNYSNGTIVTSTWVADPGGTQAFSFQASARAVLNGVSLFDISPADAIPEPSTFVLGTLGLLGLGCVALRRKHRRA